MGDSIPFVDLGAQLRSIRGEVGRAMDAVLESSAFIGGPQVQAFEDAFAEYSGFAAAVGVANGTDAIQIALLAAGCAPGDEIVIPAHTYVATAEGVSHAGGRLRLADVDAETFCLTPETLEAALSPATKAVVHVPIYGNLSGLDRVAACCQRHGLRLIVDAAQAHGACLDGRKLGQLCDVATFSFYPSKNLGAYGDAGAVATNDPALAQRARQLGQHGALGKFDHELIGFNSRLDGLQAAVLQAKLPHLDGWNASRRQWAEAYRDQLQGLAVLELPVETVAGAHVYHLFVVRHEARDRLQHELAQAGVATGVHYPSPIHLLPAFRELGYAEGDFPNAERVCGSVLSLPMYAELGRERVQTVATRLRRVLDA